MEPHFKDGRFFDFPGTIWDPNSSSFNGYNGASNVYTGGANPGVFMINQRYCIWRLVWSHCSSVSITKWDFQRSTNKIQLAEGNNKEFATIPRKNFLRLLEASSHSKVLAKSLEDISFKRIE